MFPVIIFVFGLESISIKTFSDKITLVFKMAGLVSAVGGVSAHIWEVFVWSTWQSFEYLEDSDSDI